MQALGKPLLFTWEEFGWEPPDEPSYLKTSEKYAADRQRVPGGIRHAEGLSRPARQRRRPEPVYFRMDDWNKLLTWGLGGDQLRVMDRKVEGTLLAAERFDAIAASLGAKDHARVLDKAWKNLLTSQSHDVGLCEYSRWQGDRMAPLDRLEDKHNFTWGAIGYNHLDAAEEQGQEVLAASLNTIAGRIGSATAKHGDLAVTVFNPSAWERTGMATTGRIYPLRAGTQGVVLRDGAGRVVPSQITKSEKDTAGNLIVADLTFVASGVPSLGYDTYYLDFLPRTVAPPETDLRIDEPQLAMENEFLKVRLSPKFGAIISLYDKRTGREMLDAEKGAFPIFKGTPNQDYELYSEEALKLHRRNASAIPAFYDTSKSELFYAEAAASLASAGAMPPAIEDSWIRWIEKGPVRATVKARHVLGLLTFETYVTVCGRTTLGGSHFPGAGPRPTGERRHGRRPSLSTGNQEWLLADLCSEFPPHRGDSRLPPGG